MPMGRSAQAGINKEQLPGGEELQKRMLWCEHHPWHCWCAWGGRSERPKAAEFSLFTPPLSCVDIRDSHTELRTEVWACGGARCREYGM